MFKLLLYTTLLYVTLSISGFAQTSPIESKPHLDQSKIDHLLKKSRNQKISAWSLLGGGTLLLIIGIATIDEDSNAYYVYDPNGNIIEDNSTPASAYFSGAGLLSMVGSIPFFIASGKNKKKAKAMMGSTYYPNTAAPTHLRTMPSVGIQISIR